MENVYLQKLGLKPGASVDEVKKAYRQLAKKYHPDISENEHSRHEFIEITEAYKFLTDGGPQARQEETLYDENPQRDYYEEMRRRARTFAFKRAQEEAARQQATLKVVFSRYKYFNYFVIIFNLILLLDYFTPSQEQRYMLYTVRETYSGGVHRADLVDYEKGSLELPPGMASELNTDSITIHVSEIFNLLKFASFQKGEQQILLKPKITVYSVLKIFIPLCLFFAAILFMLPDYHVNKITVLLFGFTFFIIEISIVFINSFST